MQKLIDELVLTLGSKSVVTGEEISQRASSFWDSSPTAALARVTPATTEQVSQVMAICNKYKQTVVVQGGLTGCVKGAQSEQKDVIISLERMNSIENIDCYGATATVQAGVILETLQQAVNEKGFRFPLDLGARGSCMLGGNIATNAGGNTVLRYGMMRNLVLGLEVVMADGTIISAMNQMLKNNAGYDNKHLFIGSEGTLGIITRAVLKLSPLPVSRNTALVAINHFDDVIHVLSHLQKDLSNTLSAYEVMWGDYVRRIIHKGGARAPMPSDYPFYVLIESEGTDIAADAEKFEEALMTQLDNNRIVDAVIAKSEFESTALWDIREGFECLLPAYVYDVSLPIAAMANYAEKVISQFKQRWPCGECFMFGHIADGNLHVFTQTGEDGDFHHESDEIVYSPLSDIGGSVSAEHGIGLEKRQWLSNSRSKNDIELMRLLKQALDPYNLLNPHKILDVRAQ